MTALTSPPLNAAQLRLLHRVGRTYVVRREAVRIGHLTLDFFRIEDPDRVLDMVAEEADLRDRLGAPPDRDREMHLPYWAQLWDSALGVARYLATSADSPLSQDLNRGGNGGSRRKSLSKEVFPPCSSISSAVRSPLAVPNVLDLGCGMALTGATAAALGASVLLADLEPPALLFGQLNTVAFGNRVRTRRLNWQRDGLDEQFDLIIGADILYEKEQWQYLEPFWRSHLAPGGTLLLGEPGRMTGEMFLPWIVQRGWELRESEQPVETRSRPIRLFRLNMLQN
jgi:predicted nicotinamide N-methyase